MSRSLDLPATEGVDTLAQELAKLQDNGKRKIAFLGSRHVPVVDKSGKLINIMSQGDFVSYSWPNLMYQVKEMTKENYFKANQVVLIIVSLLIYTLVTTVLAIKLV